MQKRLLVPSVSFLAFAFLTACSDSNSPSTASGGATTGGAQSGGSSTTSGGSSSGGSSSGGRSSDGGSSGGAATGGANPVTGGAATTGGSNAGGQDASGGANEGGEDSSGGKTTVTGGASSGGSGGASTGGTAGAGGGTSGGKWVGTWVTSLQTTEPRNLPIAGDDTMPQPENTGLANSTLRQIIHVSIGGTKLRLRLSNEFGVNPVTFDSVHVANSKGGGAIDVATDKVLSFSGKPTVTIPAGQAVTTDPFDYTLAPLGDLAISIKIGAQSKDATGHPGSRATSYLQTGDAVSEPTLANATLKPVHWYFISELDVLADEKSAAVVVLGDSITDGRGSTNDGNDRWPDALARRLQADPTTAHIAVLNQGIGGNQVLKNGLGPTAKARFDRDVLGVAGAKWLIVLHGVNDIGNEKTTDLSADLIAAYQEFITKAHSKDIKAFGSPILPFKDNGNYDVMNPIGLTQRAKVNEWVRKPGNFDAVVDLDAAVRDPATPDKLLAEYADLTGTPAGSTDWLHLNPKGYKAMADAVDLKLFK